MKKQFTIKIFKKKAGARSKQLVNELFAGFDKKEAFNAGREELIRIAQCDLARGLSESSEEDVFNEIESIKNGSNNYYFDQTTYSFKVFSKTQK